MRQCQPIQWTYNTGALLRTTVSIGKGQIILASFPIAFRRCNEHYRYRWKNWQTFASLRASTTFAVIKPQGIGSAVHQAALSWPLAISVTGSDLDLERYFC
jgi:hypothetical protein